MFPLEEDVTLPVVRLTSPLFPLLATSAEEIDTLPVLPEALPPDTKPMFPPFPASELPPPMAISPPLLEPPVPPFKEMDPTIPSADFPDSTVTLPEALEPLPDWSLTVPEVPASDSILADPTTTFPLVAVLIPETSSTSPPEELPESVPPSTMRPPSFPPDRLTVPPTAPAPPSILTLPAAPLGSLVEPLEITTLLPAPLLVLPAARVMPPALPREESPETNSKEPEFSEAEDPEETMMDPEAPALSVAGVVILTAPLD